MGRRENNIFSIFGVLSLLHKPVITKRKKSSFANKPNHCARLEGHEKVKKCLLKEFKKSIWIMIYFLRKTICLGL